MKRLLLLIVLLASSLLTFSQSGGKAKKLSPVEASEKTPDQRLVYETERRSKGKKKNMSVKRKVRIQEKQDHQAQRLKAAKRRRPR